MFFGRWTSWQVTRITCTLSRLTSLGLVAGLLVGILVTAGLMSGCGESGSPLADTYANYEPSLGHRLQKKLRL